MTNPSINHFKVNEKQYNIVLHFVISGTFKDTSRGRLYKELGLESLAQRKFYKFKLLEI